MTLSSRADVGPPVPLRAISANSSLASSCALPTSALGSPPKVLTYQVSYAGSRLDEY